MKQMTGPGNEVTVGEVALAPCRFGRCCGVLSDLSVA
jgi:hypothetical protein